MRDFARTHTISLAGQKRGQVMDAVDIPSTLHSVTEKTERG